MLTADLILPPATDPFGHPDATGSPPGRWSVSNSILLNGRKVIGLTTVPGTSGPAVYYFQTQVNGVWGYVVGAQGATLQVGTRNQGIVPQSDFFLLSDPSWALLPDEIRVRADMTDAFGAALPLGTGATVTLLLAPAAAVTLDDLNAVKDDILAALAAEAATNAAATATVLAAIQTAKAAIIAAIPGNHQH